MIFTEPPAVARTWCGDWRTGEWEGSVPRTVTGRVRHRRQRLEGLGDAVVPDQAEYVGRMVVAHAQRLADLMRLGGGSVVMLFVIAAALLALVVAGERKEKENPLSYDEKRFKALVLPSIEHYINEAARLSAELRLVRDWLPDGQPFMVLIASGRSAVDLSYVLEATGALSKSTMKPALHVMDGKGKDLTDVERKVLEGGADA